MARARKASAQPAKAARAKAARPAPPPEPPLATELIRAPAAFGEALRRSAAPLWQYWPAPLLAGLLSGLSYALIVRPQVTWLAGVNAGMALPGVFSHAVNVLGGVFLTAFALLLMWALGSLAAGPKRAEIKLLPTLNASFALLLPPLLLALVLSLILAPDLSTLKPPAGADARALQTLAVRAVAQTPAAGVLIWTVLLGAAAQVTLLFLSLRGALGAGRAVGVALLALLPLLLFQFVGVAPLAMFR